MAVARILADKGEDMDVRSFAWTVAGALFEKGVIGEEGSESMRKR
ncbi:MAG: hypothetical protein QXX77_09805 [Candidatus Methanosuratincola sp.]